MGLFSWLFGKADAPESADSGNDRASDARWRTAETGNQTQTVGDRRLTVYPKDGGWAYAIAHVEDAWAPVFSEVYTTREAAAEDAIRAFNGERTIHELRWLCIQERNRASYADGIRNLLALHGAALAFILDAPQAKVGDLRKRERDVEKAIRHLPRYVSEGLRCGVEDALIAKAEDAIPKLDATLASIRERIATAPKPRRTGSKPEESTLDDDLAAAVDDLINALEAATPVEDTEIERLHREHFKRIGDRLLEGATYGEASGGMEHLRSSEAELRAFMKRTDQDLAWQCRTVADSFRGYLKTGETPAPHYAMRVAILLAKAKDSEREKRFLAAWCRHFAGRGVGQTYRNLADRARKVGAIE